MAHEALQSYRGDRLAYIGEKWFGATADACFHQLLADEWDVAQVIALPRWAKQSDCLTIYRRRR
jgi:hypothetical protein